ncbi:MAG: cupin domain-containing protein [Myxococcota bacterium]
MDADTIKKILNLAPLTFEGGFFRETYRSSVQVPTEALPERYGAARSAGTAIYYLLDASTFSGLHRLKSPETYHFYLGDPVEMLMLHPSGDSEVVILGSDLAAGHLPQHTVPDGVWQGSRLVGTGCVALMGTTMYPGFSLEDFEAAPKALERDYPQHAALIRALTR